MVVRPFLLAASWIGRQVLPSGPLVRGPAGDAETVVGSASMFSGTTVYEVVTSVLASKACRAASRSLRSLQSAQAELSGATRRVTTFRTSSKAGVYSSDGGTDFRSRPRRPRTGRHHTTSAKESQTCEKRRYLTPRPPRQALVRGSSMITFSAPCRQISTRSSRSL